MSLSTSQIIFSLSDHKVRLHLRVLHHIYQANTNHFSLKSVVVQQGLQSEIVLRVGIAWFVWWLTHLSHWKTNSSKGRPGLFCCEKKCSSSNFLGHVSAHVAQVSYSEWHVLCSVYMVYVEIHFSQHNCNKISSLGFKLFVGIQFQAVASAPKNSVVVSNENIIKSYWETLVFCILVAGTPVPRYFSCSLSLSPKLLGWVENYVHI